jgi:hypothetical protein
MSNVRKAVSLARETETFPKIPNSRETEGNTGTENPVNTGESVFPSVGKHEGNNEDPFVSLASLPMGRRKGNTGSAWLAEQINIGQRAATETTCTNCGAHILTGLDSDTAALHVTVNLTPLASPLHEAVAVLEQRPTYSVRRGASRTRRTVDIVRRYPNSVGHPASHGAAIHAEHRCTPQPTGELW